MTGAPKTFGYSEWGHEKLDLLDETFWCTLDEQQPI